MEMPWNQINKAVKYAVVICVFGCVAGVISNALAQSRGGGIPWFRESIVPVTVDDSLLYAGTGDVVAPLTVSLEQAKRLFDEQHAVFLDARDEYAYWDGCIPGAVNLPWEGYDFFRSVLDDIPQDTTVVVYCDGHGCELSIHLGEQMTALGYRKVRVFYGGWIEWRDAGFPTAVPTTEGQ